MLGLLNVGSLAGSFVLLRHLGEFSDCLLGCCDSIFVAIFELHKAITNYGKERAVMPVECCPTPQLVINIRRDPLVAKLPLKSLRQRLFRLSEELRLLLERLI